MLPQPRLAFTTNYYAILRHFMHDMTLGALAVVATEFAVEKFTFLWCQIKTDFSISDNIPPFFFRMFQDDIADPANGLSDFFSLRLQVFGW